MTIDPETILNQVQHKVQKDDDYGLWNLTWYRKLNRILEEGG
jgi:hypothetical protein